MGLRETVNFEGLVASNSFASLPDPYDRLHWINVGVVGKRYIDHHFGPDIGGYSILDRKAMAYGSPLETSNNDSSFFSEGATFTLKSGAFSSIQVNGVDVTFTAWKNGHVKGTVTVSLDNAGSVLTFDSHFRHIDKVQITTEEGSNGYVGMENIKVVLDDPAATHPVAVHDQVHHPVDQFHHPIDSFGGMLC